VEWEVGEAKLISLMAQFMWEIGNMIKEMVMDLWFFHQVITMKVLGTIIDNKDMGHMFMLKIN
jgi:hypothetical protein